jgi:hypothetical protein
MRPWKRNEKIALAALAALAVGLISIAVALVVGLNAFFVPEVRYFLRLDRRPLAAPQSQQASGPSLPAPVAPQNKELPAMNGETAMSVA